MTAPTNPVAHDGRDRLWVSIALGLLTFLLTRQMQLPGPNGLAAPLALALVATLARWDLAARVMLPILTYAAFSLVAGLFAGHELTDSVRFTVIVLATLAAFCVPPLPISPVWPLAPLALQAAVIVGIALFLGVVQDPLIAAGVRATVLGNGWGDIYSFDGRYYRVQLIGNALLPLLFMIGVWRWRAAPSYRWMTVIAFLGLVAAGNLTYFIAAGLAVAIRYGAFVMRRSWARWLAVLVVLMAAVFAGSVAETVIERKFDGSDSSMGVRFDQIDAAIEQVSDSPMQLLFGAGLGARFPDGRERDYSEYQYIELQALYLLLQLGLIGMALYAATLVYLTRTRMSPEARTLFWLYILSGITNPYILDTNQIAATLLLIFLFPNRPSAPVRSAVTTRPDADKMHGAVPAE